MFYSLQGTAQRFVLPVLGRGRRSRPARKMTRRRKLLEVCAREAPQRQVHTLLGAFALKTTSFIKVGVH